FTADGRIDFRELVKDLASVFRTRIELRQIGVRDETKILGGIGICGRPLCCYAHQSDFIPVSIKMAKEQNPSRNPSMSSGGCGRLMCGLKYEQETYEDLNSRLPGVGDYVTAADGSQGEVSSVNVLRQMVKVVVTLDKDEKEVREYPAAELKFRPRRKKEKGNRNKEKLSEERELEALDGQEKADSTAKPERRGKSERRERPERREKTERRDNAEHREKTERRDHRPNQERRRGKVKPHDKKSETV
ncbi:MAG: hypothetical protein LUD73_05950, partial [Lachnospiraceae bacterium]|nr:hypothetical protein [Lachnospiraceae bacterium]